MQKHTVLPTMNMYDAIVSNSCTCNSTVLFVLYEYKYFLL